ncbi:hypothetical protein BAL199_20395 [alpha proteobacterium BAL199]|nr:hypothetical protein BAL199_20395 [alpha proteobacterium BAL199]
MRIDGERMHLIEKSGLSAHRFYPAGDVREAAEW